MKRLSLTIQRRNYSLIDAFETIAKSRRAEREFSDAVVQPSTMKRIVELAQMAPSSFNLQPYKIIIVQSSGSKDLVSTAMNPGNDRHVLKAAHTVVFAADTDPGRNTRALMDLETVHGAKPAYVSSLPAKVTLLVGKGAISNRLRAIGSHFLSPLSPAPVIRPTNEAWGMKNASFAAMQFMLAATACGLRTHPMEGFDERRLRAVLQIPDEYAIPLVVCVGHSADPHDPLPALAAAELAGPAGTSAVAESLPPKARFALEDICYVDQFGKPARFDW